MLVMSRRRDESIIIGDGNTVLQGPIVIKVTDIRGDKARIGVAAHFSVPVHRQEIYERIQAQAAEYQGV